MYLWSRYFLVLLKDKVCQTFDAFDAIVYLMIEIKGVIIEIDLVNTTVGWVRHKQVKKDLLFDRIMKTLATVITIEEIMFCITMMQSMALIYLFTFSFRMM